MRKTVRGVGTLDRTIVPLGQAQMPGTAGRRRADVWLTGASLGMANPDVFWSSGDAAVRNGPYAYAWKSQMCRDVGRNRSRAMR